MNFIINNLKNWRPWSWINSKLNVSIILSTFKSRDGYVNPNCNLMFPRFYCLPPRNVNQVCDVPVLKYFHVYRIFFGLVLSENNVVLALWLKYLTNRIINCGCVVSFAEVSFSCMPCKVTMTFLSIWKKVLCAYNFSPALGIFESCQGLVFVRNRQKTIELKYGGVFSCKWNYPALEGTLLKWEKD